MNDPFTPHPNLSDDINNNIAESELAGGCWWDKVPVGGLVEVQTQNTLYQIKKTLTGETEIKGHHRFCPEWTATRIHGSTWGGSMLKMGFIGRDMHLEFGTDRDGTVTTSRIQEVREIK